MTFKIGFQILNIGDSADVVKMIFYWESGLNEQTNYWMDIAETSGYKWSFFLGNVKETAKEIYDTLIDKLFDNVEVIAK